jgi:hypothetical protein
MALEQEARQALGGPLFDALAATVPLVWCNPDVGSNVDDLTVSAADITVSSHSRMHWFPHLCSEHECDPMTCLLWVSLLFGCRLTTATFMDTRPLMTGGLGYGNRWQRSFPTSVRTGGWHPDWFH